MKGEKQTYHIIIFKKEINKGREKNLDDLLDHLNEICQIHKGIENLHLPSDHFSERGGDMYKKATHYLVGTSVVKNGLDKLNGYIVTHIIYLNDGENKELIKDFIKFYGKKNSEKIVRIIS